MAFGQLHNKLLSGSNARQKRKDHLNNFHDRIKFYLHYTGTFA